MTDTQILDAYFQQLQLRYLHHKVRVVDLDYPAGPAGTLVPFVRPDTWPRCMSIAVQGEQKEELVEIIEEKCYMCGSLDLFADCDDCGKWGCVDHCVIASKYGDPFNYFCHTCLDVRILQEMSE